MTQYSITVPFRVVSDGGASCKWRPGMGRERVLHDAPSAEEKRNPHQSSALETYFNDVYFLFLYRLTRFALGAESSAEEKQKLRGLFEDFMRTRELIESNATPPQSRA